MKKKNFLDFNSIKVRLKPCEGIFHTPPDTDFNSIKVRLKLAYIHMIGNWASISIP